ncbi:MAG: SusC/RagA family TonB-linked outer membrane protein [Bacteroidaceae bacterium]|nr:SusC/RagA family TonB-linked outer membrane protein [Bacteroidaceae bacterium]
MKALRIYMTMAALVMTATVMAQITRISGTVSDDFDVLPGVNVVEIDASNRMVNATVTDMNGNFVLPIKSQKNKVKFSYMGFKPQVLPINKTVFKIKLEENAKQMETVNVVAKKKLKTSGLAIPEREVSFSAQSISAKEFEGLGITSVDEALQGRIAGLDIVANSGDLGAGTSMRLRGASTVSTLTSNEPLIVVNGNVWNVDMSDFDTATANDEKFAQLLNVNTEDIEDIKVLKDAAATAIWGSQGANGVIEITTKRGHRGAPQVSYSVKLTMTHQPKGMELLTGDQYTMLLKEAYFNPMQQTLISKIPELNYVESDSEYLMFNKNTDWVDLVQQNGLRQNHYVSISGGDEKTLFRISGGYDHETGTIIKQKLNRLSTRMALDYYVNDRIKIMSNFALTYTKNNRNYDGLLGIARTKMPNLSPWRYDRDADGNEYNTGEYYIVPQYAFTNHGDSEIAGGTNPFSNRFNDQRNSHNPLASADKAVNDQTTYDITPELELEYKLLGLDDNSTQLRYNGRVVMNVYNDYTDQSFPRSLVSTPYYDNGSAYSFSRKNLAFTTTHTLTFQPKFKNEDHTLLALGRFQLVSGSSSSQSTNAYRLPTSLETVSSGAYPSGMGSGFNEWRSLYYTFSSHYAYKGRYMLAFSMRLDATTKFGENSRWGWFPAVSGRWNIIDEPWMKVMRDKVKMTMFSVRPGWGWVGNPPTADYLYMNSFSLGAPYLGTYAMNPNGLKLTELRWENKYTFNIGFDLGFFEDRLKFVLELYHQTTKDMLMANAGIPSSNGWGSLRYQNVGDMLNKGWEFQILGERLLKKGKFYADVNVNFANNRNVITKMDPLILEGLNIDWEEKNRSVLQRVQVDNPFGAIYGFRSKGVYQYSFNTAQDITRGKMPQALKNQGFTNLQECLDAGITFPVAVNENGQYVRDAEGNPIQQRFAYKDGNRQGYGFKGGDAIYEDVNHDGNINQLDIVYLGNSLPKLTGGFGFKLHYERLTLNAQFNYRIDYDILNMARLDMEAMTSNDNQSQAVNYRWRKEGDVTTIPRALNGGAENSTNYNTLVSDRFVEDGSFLRLNYLQLSYSLDPKLLKKWHIKQLNVYASANNLFCLTKYTGVDPEIGYGGYGVTTDTNKTPRSKSYTVGLTIGF